MPCKPFAVALAAAATLGVVGIAFACDFTHETAAHSKMLGNVGTGGEVKFTPRLAAAAGNNMSFLSQVTLSQMGGGAGSSLWGWVDPETRREFAIMGRSTGTSFIDVTNPLSPQVIANLPRISGSSATSWREPKVIGNRVFIGVDSTTHGIQSVDLNYVKTLSGNATIPTSQVQVYTGSGTFSLSRAHTLAINAMGGSSDSPYLYVAGSNRFSGGIYAINVGTPTQAVPNPALSFAGGFAADGYTHEMQVVTYNGPDAQHAGKEIAFAYNVDTLTVVDVSNKSAMSQLSRTVQPARGYVHQGWLTSDQRYILSNDELDETGNLTGGKTRTHFWDVSDLDSPTYKGFYEHNQATIDHNLYIVGNKVFMSNYSMGLQVFELGNLEDPNSQNWLTKVGSYDTYPLNDAIFTGTGGSNFNGAWNNYPFFPSGNIAISDINGGLFMVRMNQPLGPSSPDYDLPEGPEIGVLSQGVPEPSALSALALLVAARRRPRQR